LGRSIFRSLLCLGPLLLIAAVATEWGEKIDPVRMDDAYGGHWVHTTDGWERARWPVPHSGSALHPAVLAALMALLSTTILVAGSPTSPPAEPSRQYVVESLQPHRLMAKRTSSHAPALARE
jgi:hypothetical protein